MPVIQRQGSLVSRINPKDFVVDFAGAAKTALNISETMKNNRLNRAKMEQGILNDQKQIELANANIDLEKEKLEGAKADRAFRKTKFESDTKLRGSQLKNAEALANKNVFDSAKNINDSKWVSDNANRMNSALSGNDWDEVDAINGEIMSKGPAAAQSWNARMTAWGKEEWTVGGETRTKAQWMSVKNGGDSKNGELGTVLTAEQKVVRNYSLKAKAMREEMKVKHNLTDKQVDKAMELQTTRFMQELRRGVSKVNLGNEVDSLGEKLADAREDIVRSERGLLAGEDVSKFTNIADRDLNAATSLYASRAIEAFSQGKIGKSLSGAERGQAIANMKRLKASAKTFGTRGFGKVWDDMKGRLGITSGLKTIDKDFEDFERAFRNAGKLEGKARTKELNKVTSEYFEWMDELMGSGALDNLEEDARVLGERAAILQGGPTAVPGALESVIPASQIVEQSFQATNDNPAGI